MSDSQPPQVPMAEHHRDAGATVTPTGVPRHYGQPAAEYAAALGSSVLIDRSQRVRLEVAGRAPGQMLNGVLAGAIPKLASGANAFRAGSWTYSAVLQPKGRMVSDLRAYSIGHPDEEMLLLDVPDAGGAALIEHLARFLPPRFARVTDRSSTTTLFSLIGPGAALAAASALEFAAKEADDAAPATVDLPALGLNAPSSFVVLSVGSGSFIVARSEAFGSLGAFDIFGDVDLTSALWEHLADHHATPAGLGVLETLRVEAGTPAFGLDMDHRTIPPEAGIEDIAIDHAKGCYTGQEVIVRIRDRGHVNRHLRGLLFEGDVTPAAGTSLFRPGQEAPAGHVTSAVTSPRQGGVIGMGYVRREIDPPVELCLGESDGTRVSVRVLTGNDWWSEPV